MKNQIILLTSLLLGSALSAFPIASESFSSDTAAGGYTSGENFDRLVLPVNNRWVTHANTGFRTQAEADGDNAFGWQSGTALVRPSNLGGLTHALMPGSTSSGYALLRGENQTGTRSSRRQLGSPVTGNEFYFSGLVSMVNGIADMRDGDRLMMGISNFDSVSAPNNFDTGFFIGLHKDAGDVYLSAFAGGQIHSLGSSLTASQASGTSMIVLRAELGAGSNNDTLTAWYAHDSATELTLAATITGLDIASSAADLTHFGLMSFVTGTVSNFSAGSAFDEMRFGTSLSAVVIPEPAHATLFFGAMVGLLLLLRRK
jgi:hypothetical protein